MTPKELSLYNQLDEVLKDSGIDGINKILTHFSNERVIAYLNDKVNKIDTSFSVKHPTEEKFPEQCKMFREVIEKMYQTHLDKNQDYSPMNILATGMVGIVTRFWDKTARIMNLHGFDIRTGEFNTRLTPPKNESIEDSFLDSAVYSIIALIYRAGKWGR